MDYTTLIDRILEAEQSAGVIAGEAETQRVNLDAELAEESARIREKYMKQAGDRLERLAREEQSKKERTLAAQDARLADTSARMERAYARYGDNWVDTLFHQVVDLR